MGPGKVRKLRPFGSLSPALGTEVHGPTSVAQDRHKSEAPVSVWRRGPLRPATWPPPTARVLLARSCRRRPKRFPIGGRAHTHPAAKDAIEAADVVAYRACHLGDVARAILEQPGRQRSARLLDELLVAHAPLLKPSLEAPCTHAKPRRDPLLRGGTPRQLRLYCSLHCSSEGISCYRHEPLEMLLKAVPRVGVCVSKRSLQSLALEYEGVDRRPRPDRCAAEAFVRLPQGLARACQLHLEWRDALARQRLHTHQGTDEYRFDPLGRILSERRQCPCDGSGADLQRGRQILHERIHEWSELHQ